MTPDIAPLSSLCDYAEGRISVANLTLSNYISTENMLQNKEGISESAGLPKIYPSHIANLPFVIPPTSKIAEYERLALPLFEDIGENNTKISAGRHGRCDRHRHRAMRSMDGQLRGSF